MIQREVLKEAVNLFGIDSQLRMAQEECAELIVSISHFMRGRTDLKSIVEEIADVQIMIDQLRIGLGVEKEVDAVLDRKIARLKHRLQAGGEG